MEIWGGNQAAEAAISVPGIDAWVTSRPHEEAASGGDIHYVSMCGGGIIGRFALADVAGHGASVSDLAVRLRDLMRRNINTLDQSRFARSLNTLFAQPSNQGRFATALLATYHAPSDHLVVCNAGHPAPLWYRAAENRWQLLTPQPGGTDAVSKLPLGIIDPTDYQQFAVALGLRDLVVLYTDALIEATPAAGGMLGEQGLLQTAAAMDPSDPAALGPALIAAVDALSGGTASRADDTTVLVLHHNGANPPRQSLLEKVRITAKMLGL